MPRLFTNSSSQDIWEAKPVWQFSNLGTLFVKIDGKPHVVREDAFPREDAVSHATRKKSSQIARDVHKALVLSLKPGAKISANGYPGNVVRVTPYGMVEVRLPGGVAAVSPEDVKLR